jgi:Flp pilus assembly protein TadG
MIAGWRRALRCRRAVGAIEFALVYTPLLLVIFGTIEFGRAAWTSEALSNIAIAAARCAGLVQSTCGVNGVYSQAMTVSYIENLAADSSVQLADPDITINTTATCAGVPGFSQVTINYSFVTPLATFLPSMSGGVPLSATACFPNNSP